MKIAAKTSLYYCILGCLWVLSGSFLLNYFTFKTIVPDHWNHYFEVSKGLLFVFLTSFFLYKFLSKILRQEEISQTQYRKIFNESPIPMWIYDIQSFQFLSVNQAALACYEYSESEFLKLTLEDLHTEEDWKVFQNILLLGDKNKCHGIWKHRKKSGDFFIVDMHSSSIEYLNRPCNLVNAINIEDKIETEVQNLELITAVSEYKKRFETQDKNLKEISWTHSHQLRAPLANILGLIQLLNRNDLADPNNFEIINKVDFCAKKLDLIIHDIVDKSNTNQSNETV